MKLYAYGAPGGAANSLNARVGKPALDAWGTCRHPGFQFILPSRNRSELLIALESVGHSRNRHFALAELCQRRLGLFPALQDGRFSLFAQTACLELLRKFFEPLLSQIDSATACGLEDCGA